MGELHRLLRRQFRTHLGANAEPPPELRLLLEAVSAAYVQSDEDRALLERSLDLSSTELLEANSEARAVLHSLPDVFLWLTNDGIVLDCRALHAEDLFLPPEDLIGKDICRIPIEGMADRFRYALAELRKGASLVSVEYSLTPCDRVEHYEARLVPLDESRLLCIIRSITARKQAEQDLEKSELRYRTLFENNPHPMWVYDLETFAFLAVNDAAVHHYGYSRDEFLAMTVLDIRPPEDLPAFRKRLKEITPGMSSSGEWRHRKKDGSLIVADISSHSLTFDGRVASLVLANDVTARRQLEDQLRQSQKIEAIGQLAGGIAHDFNNLLTAILGYSQLLKDRLSPNGPGLSDIQEIERAAKRAATLTGQLLAFSRQQVLQPRIIDLNDVLADVEKMLHRLIGDDIELAVHHGAGLFRIKADPGQIEQVVINLAVNARDAMSRGGTLIFETKNVQIDEDYTHAHADFRPGPYVMLSVSDTGCGMPKEILDHIFEPFFTTKEEGKGTGLGLSTVHGIVKQSGGHVEARSEAGKGTTFKIYLPALADAAAAVPLVERKMCCGGSETILVVEDEPPLRAVVTQMLRSRGYRVLEAPDGPSALDMCDREMVLIDLVISDVVMPKLSGPDFVRQLLQRQPSIRVIYMSGYTDLAVIHQGVMAAEIAYLQKPFTADVLLQKVRETLDEERAEAA